MRLYHFTSKASASSIAREGLTKGVLILGALGPEHHINQHCQWLVDRKTLGDTWLNKSRRNVMVVLDIPDNDPNLLNPRRWKRLIRPLVAKGFWCCYTRPECDHWWLYHGEIPVEWIKEIKEEA